VKSEEFDTILSMQLVVPSINYIESYREALAEFESNSISGFWKFFGPIEDPEIYISNIRKYEHKGTAPKDFVPASVFWLIVEDEFIGHVSIRHELNDSLRKFGGHIGYAIRPSKQQQAFGSILLQLALPKAKSIGIQSALVTCDADAVASRKIIEKNGGVFQKEIEKNGKKILQFLIPL